MWCLRLEVIMGRAAAKIFCPLVGPGINSGRIYLSKARYFGPKLAGFCGLKRAGPKNRLKSHFWLAQSQKKYGWARSGPTRGPKNMPKNGPGQNDHLYLRFTFDWFCSKIRICGLGFKFYWQELLNLLKKSFLWLCSSRTWGREEDEDHVSFFFIYFF